MATLVYLEDHEGELVKGSLGVLSKAAQLGGDVAAVVAGSGVKELAPQARALRRQARLRRRRPGARRAAPAAARRRAREARRGPGLRHGDLRRVRARRRTSPRGSRRASTPGSTGTSSTSSSATARSSASGPRSRTRCSWRSAGRESRGWRSIRSGTFEPAESGGDAEVEDVAVEIQDFSQSAAMLERAHAESEGPSIEDADVIVAGGRGLGEPDRFELLEELAKALGGAVAATRAVVDAGWYPVRGAGRPDGEDRRAEALHRMPASRARSSTRSACRRRAPSSPSTRIRTLPSSSTPTWASSATSTRSSPS